MNIRYPIYEGVYRILTYELFGTAGYSEKDYIRLSEEYRSEFTKTSRTSHKNRL